MTIPMHAGHPLVVHLPLIAFVAAVGFDLVDAWSATPRFRRAASVLWWAALVGAAAAIATGLWAYGRVDHSDPAHAVMTLHRNVALATVALLLVAAIWRWRRARSRPAAILAAVGLAGLVWVGDLGADLVYRHALGLPSATLAEILKARGAEGDEEMPHDHAGMPSPLTKAAPTDSAVDTGRVARPRPTHTHKDSTTPKHQD